MRWAIIQGLAEDAFKGRPAYLQNLDSHGRAHSGLNGPVHVVDPRVEEMNRRNAEAAAKRERTIAEINESFANQPLT